MSEAKACLKCGRGIDRWASICPYCNWNQSETPGPEAIAAPSPASTYVPPEETGLKRRLLMIGGGILLLIASFGVGLIINRDGAPKRAPGTLEEQAAEHNAEAALQKPKRADTPLVPAGAGGIEEPITSAPAAIATTTDPNAKPNEYDRTDATAVSAVEYGELAKRAKEEKARMATLVDPRSLTGPAYAQAQAPRRPNPRPALTSSRDPRLPGNAPSASVPGNAGVPVQHAASRVASTRPIAEYRPMPSIHARGTARLTLLIGSDGRVERVNIEKPLEGGNTAALLAAVQRWRFKPATENGEPVAAPYSVDINFQ
jgi:TonB family protein